MSDGRVRLRSALIVEYEGDWSGSLWVYPSAVEVRNQDGEALLFVWAEGDPTDQPHTFRVRHVRKVWSTDHLLYTFLRSAIHSAIRGPEEVES